MFKKYSFFFFQEIEAFKRKHIDPKGSWLTFVRYSDDRTTEKQTNRRKRKRQKKKRNKTLVSTHSVIYAVFVNV